MEEINLGLIAKISDVEKEVLIEDNLRCRDYEFDPGDEIKILRKATVDDHVKRFELKPKQSFCNWVNCESLHVCEGICPFYKHHYCEDDKMVTFDEAKKILDDYINGIN